MTVLFMFIVIIVLSITQIIMYRRRSPNRALVYRAIHLVIASLIFSEVYQESDVLLATQIGLFYATAYCYFGKVYNQIRGRDVAEKFHVIRLFFFFLFLVATSLVFYFGTREAGDLLTPIIFLLVIELIVGRMVRGFARSANKRDDKYLSRTRFENDEAAQLNEEYQNPFNINKEVQDALDRRYEETYTDQVKKTDKLLYKELPPLWTSTTFMPIRSDGRRYQAIGGSPSGNILLVHFLDESGQKVTDPVLANKLHHTFFYVNTAFLLSYGPFRQIEYLFRNWDSERVRELAQRLPMPTNNGEMTMGEMLVTLDGFLRNQQSIIDSIESLKQKLAGLRDELTPDQADIVRDSLIRTHEQYMERIRFLLTYRSEIMRLVKEQLVTDHSIIQTLDGFYKEALLYENTISDVAGSLVDTSDLTMLQPLAFERNWLGKEKTEAIHSIKTKMARMKQLILASIIAIPLYIAGWVWSGSDALVILLLFFALLLTPIIIGAMYGVIRANGSARSTLAYLDRIQTPWRKPVYYRGKIINKTMRYLGPFMLGGFLIGIALAWQSFDGNILYYLVPAAILLVVGVYFFMINPTSTEMEHLVVFHKCGFFYHNLDHPMQNMLKTKITQDKEEIRIYYSYINRIQEVTISTGEGESFKDVTARVKAWSEDHGIKVEIA
ncbi:hypothetical protein FLK61_40730 [Paenalkalicoccus suaedae]|uniref:Uncharacterized protein n=1 Tax=Paenalkalicoccus suaedae TaxID=2592382 RepID=A0A859FJF1_9BACI|nr:hypothetical protein [Paenalkalicoccus suaedae]QKS72928.1 hypothetical protein FLK61_40730 [Paenalkalicoccus suaedae]